MKRIISGLITSLILFFPCLYLTGEYLDKGRTSLAVLSFSKVERSFSIELTKFVVDWYYLIIIGILILNFFPIFIYKEKKVFYSIGISIGTCIVFLALYIYPAWVNK